VRTSWASLESVHAPIPKTYNQSIAVLLSSTTPGVRSFPGKVKTIGTIPKFSEIFFSKIQYNTDLNEKEKKKVFFFIKKKGFYR